MHYLMRVMQVSERFACRVTGQHRTTQRHRRASETLADRDAALRAWLRQWAKQHPAGGFAAPTTPPAPRAGWSTTNASNDCGARRVCGCRSAAAANASAPAPRPRSRLPPRQIECGRWTFNSTLEISIQPPPTRLRAQLRAASPLRRHLPTDNLRTLRFGEIRGCDVWVDEVDATRYLLVLVADSPTPRKALGGLGVKYGGPLLGRVARAMPGRVWCKRG